MSRNEAIHSAGSSVVALNFSNSGLKYQCETLPIQASHLMDNLPRVRDVITTMMPELPNSGSSLLFNLIRGSTIRIPQHETVLRVGLSWDLVSRMRDDAVDLDVSAVMLDSEGDLCDKIFFKRPMSDDGAVEISKDNFTGRGRGDDEEMTIRLAKVDAQVQHIVIMVHIFTESKSLQDVKRSVVRLMQASDGSELCRFLVRD